jgi:hypothetical protein
MNMIHMPVLHSVAEVRVNQVRGVLVTVITTRELPVHVLELGEKRMMGSRQTVVPPVVLISGRLLAPLMTIILVQATVVDLQKI